MDAGRRERFAIAPIAVVLIAVVAAALPAGSSAIAAGPASRSALPGSRAAATAALDRVLGPEAVETRWPRRASSAGRVASSHAARIAAVGPASQVGAWEPPFQIGNYAIHAALLPTGKVLFWGYPQADPVTGVRANAGEAVLWDPVQGTGAASLSAKPPPLVSVAGQDVAAPVFCSGQSPLPDGELLVTGGTLAYPDPATGNDWEGINTAFTFNPWTETWTRQPDMLQGRWYPTQTELPDGQVAVLSGYTAAAPGGVYNRDLEVFTPSTQPGGVGTFVHETQGDRQMSLYPHLTLMPDGQTLLLGPERDYSAHWDVGFLDPGTFTWADSVPGLAQDRFGSNTVLVPSADPAGSHRVMVVGGAQGEPPAAMNSTVTFDEQNAAAGPQPDAARLNVARWQANTVLLPDGSMAVVGGGAGDSGDGSPVSRYWTNGDEPGLLQVELYDPASGTWRLGPAEAHFRTYHSVALLLPDGRVLSAGDDHHDDLDGGQTAEIYDPPYLLHGTARPVISSAPSAVGYGASFSVDTPSQISQAVLMSPSAVTHGVDMSQRYVRLGLVSSSAGSGVVLKAPPSADAAPPGYYMLFLIDSSGVPSVASWVKVGPSLPADPVANPSGGVLASPAQAAGGPGGGVPQGGVGTPYTNGLRLMPTPQTLASVHRHGAVRLRVRSFGPETVELVLRAVPRGARSSRAGAPVLASGRHVFRAATTATVELRLRRRGRRLLAPRHSPRVEVVASVITVGQARRVARALLVLRGRW